MVVLIQKRGDEWAVALLQNNGEVVLDSILRTDKPIIAHGYAAHMLRIFSLHPKNLQIFTELTNVAIQSMTKILGKDSK